MDKPPQTVTMRLVGWLVPRLPKGLADLVSAVMDGWQTSRERQVMLLAAGLSYHAFLAIFPALIAGVLLYGLFVDPATIIAQVTRLTATMPAEVQTLILQQVELILSQPEGLGAGLVISLVIAAISASSGISSLMTAINATYGTVQRRSYLKRRLISFVAIIAGVIFMALMLALVALAPAVLGSVQLGVAPRWIIEIARWLVTALLFAGALVLVYRVFPEDRPPSLRWASVGAGTAAVLFLAASAGFSLYVSSFGSYSATYGALAGIVITLLWLWLLSFAVLLGAQINVVVAARSDRARQAADNARVAWLPRTPAPDWAAEIRSRAAEADQDTAEPDGADPMEPGPIEPGQAESEQEEIQQAGAEQPSLVTDERVRPARPSDG